MKLSIAFSSLAALVFPGSVVGQGVGYCDPTLPCETTMLSCPCAAEPSMPTVGKSGKAPSASLSGVCGEVTGYNCCGVDGYPPCWFNYWNYEAIPRDCDPTGGTPGYNCCGFAEFPPCGSSVASIGKSGKATSLVSTTPTCGNANGQSGPNPLCCGFEFYPPCTCALDCDGTGCCGAGWLPLCPSSGLSGKSGKEIAGTYPPGTAYDFDCNVGVSGGKGPGKGMHTSTSQHMMEQLSAEIDGAVEEAVEQMVNIGELNVYESSVNVYKYGKDGEGDAVNVVASGDN